MREEGNEDGERLNGSGLREYKKDKINGRGRIGYERIKRIIERSRQ